MLKKEAVKLSEDINAAPLRGVNAIICLVLVLVFWTYVFSEMYYDYLFDESRMHLTVAEKVIESHVRIKGEKKIYRLVMASGNEVEKGPYSPRFKEVFSAVEEGRSLRVWWYNYHFFPESLSNMFPGGRTPRIVQIEAGDKIILSLDDFRKDKAENLWMLMFFGCLILLSACTLSLFLWAFTLRK